jgi:ubiquinone biosynthesis accessory factor UbiJ
MAGFPLPLAQTALSGLNHVLDQQPALRDRMRAHAGRCIRILVKSPLGTVHADARIGPQGMLTATVDEAPAVTLTLGLTLDAVFAGLRGGPEGLGPHLKVEGDVMVAAAVGELARSLHWDYEEDLSRVVGDVAAHRIGEAVRGVQGRVERFQARSEDAVRHQFAGGEGPLVSRDSLRLFTAEIAAVADRITRLEQAARR